MQATLESRLDDADAAAVGRMRSIGPPPAGSTDPVRLLTFEVEQRVKGDLDEQADADGRRLIRVNVPHRTDCDVAFVRDRTVGLLLTTLPAGGWYATACSVVDAGALTAVGGEPRGGPIKVAIGIALLALVLFWSFRRLRRGARPELPYS